MKCNLVFLFLILISFFSNSESSTRDNYSDLVYKIVYERLDGSLKLLLEKGFNKEEAIIMYEEFITLRADCEVLQFDLMLKSENEDLKSIGKMVFDNANQGSNYYEIYSLYLIARNKIIHWDDYEGPKPKKGRKQTHNEYKNILNEVQKCVNDVVDNFYFKIDNKKL